MTNRCNNCFRVYDSELDLCPFCGYAEGEPAAESYFLYPGMVLNNRYIVGEYINSGGFGIIYKAWDKSLNTIVAIKEYYYTGIAARQPGTQDVLVYAQNRRAEFQHFLNRFLDEARYTAKFSKDNSIVNVYEFFEANNTAYMVMEFLDGIPLNKYLKENTMAPKQCLEVIQSVCSALKTVHGEGVIHRDISPDNIMLCADGKVKLFDFGAARFSQRKEQDVMKHTQVLKPGFSPPEQYQSISKQDQRTDIYALGATLYYMITGVKPVESTNRIEESKDNLIPPQELKPDLPDYLNDTVQRAMAVEMHLRFSSVEEFAKALNKEKKVLNITAEKKRRRKNRLISVLGAVLAIAAGFAAFFYNYLEAAKENQLPPGAEIEFWYVATGEANDEAWGAIVDEFIAGYAPTDVKIILKPYPAGEYNEALKAANEQGSLPALFASAGVDDAVLANALSAAAAADNAAKAKGVFFSKYRQVFPDAKQFPIGFVMPVKFVNNVPIGETATINNDKALFLSGRTPEYLGDTADYFEVQAALPARYRLVPVDKKEAACRYTELLSIGNCDEDQLQVVNKFLVFLISENVQDRLHIQYHDGSLPLNRAALKGFVAIYDEYAGFFDKVEDYTIEKPDKTVNRRQAAPEPEEPELEAAS